MALSGCFVGGSLCLGVGRLTFSGRSPEPDCGGHGADLNFLRRFHTAPRVEGESNHYIDLWSPRALAVLARVNGLTNNHALFVDSHGKAVGSRRDGGYCFYPHAALLGRRQKTPLFSPADLATVLGPESAANIHNILLAGCNEEKRFRSEELRRYFVNATNITYMTPGELAFKPMFYQAIALPSSEIKPLYGKIRKAADGLVECEIADGPGHGAKQLGAYVADLYHPGAAKPYRTQPAGRELLEAPGLPAGARTVSVRSAQP